MVSVSNTETLFHDKYQICALYIVPEVPAAVAIVIFKLFATYSNKYGTV